MVIMGIDPGYARLGYGLLLSQERRTSRRGRLLTSDIHSDASRTTNQTVFLRSL